MGDKINSGQSDHSDVVDCGATTTAAASSTDARFASLTSLSDDAYWEQDQDLQFTELSGGNLGLAGFDTDTVLGKTPWDCGIVPVGPGGSWDRDCSARLGQPAFTNVVCRRTNTRGELRYLSISGRPRLDSNQRFAGYCGIARDITEAKRAEQLMRLEHLVSRSLAQARSAAGALRAAIRAVCETEHWECGRYFFWDDKLGALRLAESWGVPDRDIQEFIERSRDIRYQPGSGLIGRVWQTGEPLWVADINKDERALRLAITDDLGIRGGFVFPLVSDGKSIGTLAFNSREVREPDPRLMQAIGVIGSQIGQLVQRKQAEEILRDSEERFRAVVDSANEAILIYDRNLQVVGGNAVAERIIGLPLSRMIGAAGFTSLLPCVREDGSPLAPQDRPTRVTIQAGRPITGRILGIQRPDGSTSWLSVNTGFLRRPGESDYYGLVSTISDITVQRQAEAALRDSEERLRSLNNLSSDWFWEQDAALRYTRLEGRYVNSDSSEFRVELGKTPQESGIEVEGGWPAHQATLLAHRPFRDVVMWGTGATGKLRYMSISGEPRFDAQARVIGYRGVGADITERKRSDQLRELEHAVNRTLNEAHDVAQALREVLRLICQAEGWACGRYLRVDDGAGVLRFGHTWQAPSPAIERYLDELREMAYAPGVGIVGRVWQSGQPIWVADIATDPRAARPAVAHQTGMHGAFCVPVASAGQTTGVLMFHSREIRKPDAQLLQAMSVVGSQIGQFVQRKSAEQARLRLGRMFAALSETNDAILHAQSPDDLYQRVCEAAVHGGKFSNTSIFLADPGALWARPVAGAGRIAEQLRESRVSFDASVPQGQGVVGLAFRTLRPSVSNDFLHDDRTRPWHAIVRDAGGRSGAALPLIRDGAAIGAVLIYDDEIDAFDDEIIRLLERMTANVMFALANFERQAEQLQAAQRIEYLATHDGLTRLPNRLMFSQVLNFEIEAAQRYDRRFAVLFIDLDRFKIINDTLGHEAGDTLLTVMAQRISTTLRSSDIVARLGGDEFVVLVQEVASNEQVAAIARKLLSTLMQPVDILGHECRVTASIGISMFPGDAQDEQALMKNADVAMYVAKEEGKNNFRFYSAGTRSQSLERLTLESSLRQALDRGEFYLDYQPKLDLASGEVSGVEALLRWRHPELGLVSPLQFIPVAEETGLIIPIGSWVIRAACAQNVAWQRAGIRPLCMAVNLSPRQFGDEHLLDSLGAALGETGMAPELLELEITESVVMGGFDRAAKQLAAIKSLGVRLAIDDFGTGYSSLAQIKRFPIDTLKIDRSFICDIPHDGENVAITKAIIAMGKALSLTIVAEGVETTAQEDFLRQQGCDQSQGYLFSKPVAPEQFAALVHRAARRALPAPATRATSTADALRA